MDKPLYLFVGKSASGKTTIANLLHDKYDYNQVWSYCTRPPRYENEPGHIFISERDFNALGELAAYTEYNSYKYGTTVEQLDQCDIYVVDVPGVETLLENYRTDRHIVIIYFDTSVHTRINRMLARNDSDAMIISRLLQDEKDDWYKQTNSLVWRHAKLENKIVDLYQVDANKNLVEVMEQVLYYMNKHVED
jgi:guanylate kinase